MQTKIAFFDIDGTLIDIQSKRITEKTLEALRRLRAGGVKICLATGRSPVALPVFPGDLQRLSVLHGRRRDDFQQSDRA